MDHDELAEAVHGGGVRHLQGDVTGMVQQVLEWSKRQLQLQESVWETRTAGFVATQARCRGAYINI